MMKEEIQNGRFADLAKQADRRQFPTFSDFLNLNEQDLLHSQLKKLQYVHIRLFGGYREAERCIAVFIPDGFDEEENHQDSFFTEEVIQCLKIEPCSTKYAEKLTHRDYLGAILSLGIDRNKTGDLLLKNNTAYLFCLRSVGEFLCDELHQIRRTQVKVSVCEEEPVNLRPETKEIQGSISSVRLDSLLSLAFQESRSHAANWISEKRVFINGRLVESNAAKVSEGNIISVRKLGRFRYVGITSETRKGRLIAHVELYV